MKHLKKLTLYLRIGSQNTFIDGTNLYNNILVNISQLDSFIFYISTEYILNSSTHRESIVDIQQTFRNIKYEQTGCIIDYYNVFKAMYHIYSLPFKFTRLGKITNNFPNIIFDTVTHLHAYDTIPMKHEFFMRISRIFPLLKCFSLKSENESMNNDDNLKSDVNSSYSIIEYSHLVSLNIMYVYIDYVAQFLLETKTYLPCLTELTVNYDQLKAVTMNFTRNSTRRNCSNVKQLITERSTRYSKDVYQYFSSL